MHLPIIFQCFSFLWLTRRETIQASLCFPHHQFVISVQTQLKSQWHSIVSFIWLHREDIWDLKTTKLIKFLYKSFISLWNQWRNKFLNSFKSLSAVMLSNPTTLDLLSQLVFKVLHNHYENISTFLLNYGIQCNYG